MKTCRNLSFILGALAATLVSRIALATDAGEFLPWNAPLDVLRGNFTGVTATSVIFIAVAIGLMVWSLGDDNRGLWKVLRGLLSLAVIIGLASGGLLAQLGLSASVL